jgi:hypothetical protein
MFHQITMIPFLVLFALILEVFCDHLSVVVNHDAALHSDLWQWSEMAGFGDLPSPREFAAASAIGNRKIVM